jgi:hypothetical protein
LKLRDLPQDSPIFDDPCILKILMGRSSDHPRHLNLDDVRTLVNASAYAVRENIGHLVNITIRWDMAESFVLRDWLDHQGRLLDKTTRWLQRNDIPVSFLWLREMGRTNGPHTHILAHVPHREWLALKQFMVDAGGFDASPNASGEAIRFSGGKFGTRSRKMRAGHLRYLLKSVDPSAIVRAPAADGGTMPLAEAIGVDDRGERRLPVVGKRCGASRTIDAAARRAGGWRELRTPAELRAYLHPGD